MTRKHLAHFVASARTAMLVIVALVLVAGCTVSRNPVSGNKRAYAYTWEQERQIGAEADKQIAAQFGVYDDADLNAYVRRIGERVLAESHLRRPATDPEFRNTPFTFRVLDSPVVNAFALPGGYVYVTRGLLSHLDNEAQLAVVLGHEIGHVAARHASESALQSQLGQIGLVTGAILGQEVLGLPAGDLLNLGGTAAQLLLLRYSRAHETDSDNLGVEYAARAGYRAAEGSQFFTSLKRLGEQQGSSIPNFMSTHPDPGQREQRIVQLAAQWAPSTSQTEVNESGYLAQIDGIVLGDDPRQGYTEGNVFYHPVLKFQFPVPSGFQVQNEPSQVVMYNQNQQAILGFTVAQQQSAQAAVQALTSQEGVKVVESGRAQSGNLPAAYAVVDVTNQNNQTIRALAYYVEYGGQVFNFVGYAASANFAGYQDTFLHTMRGFASLTDSRRLNVQPVRLDVVSAPRTAEFRSLLPALLPSGLSAESLAILNQLQLNTQVQSGTKLKLPAR